MPRVNTKILTTGILVVFRGLLIMEALFNILFVIAFIAFILCLCVFIAGIFDAFQKNELPEIEDVVVGKGEI